MTALVAPGPGGGDSAQGGRPCRSLHVIDLESLADAGDASAASRGGRTWPPDRLLRRAWTEYVQEVGIQRGDHALLGLRSGRCGRLADLLATSGAQLRVARDACGVRAELAGSVDVRHAARRFDWLVIAGGCEELATLAAAGRGAGMRVWRVSGPSPAVPALGGPGIRWATPLPGHTAA